MQLPSLITGKRFTLPRPEGSADAVLLAQLAEREKKAGKLTAIVTSDAADAQRLMDELVFFAPDLRCVMFPDWETLPYDTFSPHQDLISERLATLWRIKQRNHLESADVVLVPATTALYRLAPPSFLAGYTFEFKVKQKLDEAQLKAQLTLAGYSHVSQVVSPGEYAVRGGLIDLFPMGSLVPYRVDLFDDEIDSIRTFDPDSQRSLYDGMIHRNEEAAARNYVNTTIVPSERRLQALTVAFEKVEPFAVSVFEPDPEFIARGAVECHEAIRLYHECITSGEWPAYPPTVQRLSLPGWVK
jgi:transcription-repair coupling factor (superfamily II helicase)